MKLLSFFINRYRALTLKESLLWFIFYSLIWIVLSLNTYAEQIEREPNYQYYQAWIQEFFWVFYFALLSPFISAVCHQCSIERYHLLRTSVTIVLFYLPFKTVYLTLVLLSISPFYLIIVGKELVRSSLEVLYIYRIVDTSPFYVAAVFITFTIIYFKNSQRELIYSAKLETELQKTQMDVLRNQLQPHFLFNTLNLISSTMYRDVDKADSIIARLGDLLRYSLSTELKPFTALKEEIKVMTSYLEIAKLRFGDRLSTLINIAPETNDIMIPAMLLQPLLENAVKYGIEPSDDHGEISLSTLVENSELIIIITNPWHQRRAQQESFGIGLSNTKNRLALIYEDLASVTLETCDEKQITLQIRLPVQQTQSLVENSIER